MKSNVEQIEALKSLRSSGSISDEEYLQMVALIEDQPLNENASDADPEKDIVGQQSRTNHTTKVSTTNSARNKISTKIFLGFGIISLLGFITMTYLYNDLKSSTDIIHQNTESYYENELSHLNDRLNQITRLKPIIVTKLDVVNLIYHKGEFIREQEGRKKSKYTIFDTRNLDYIALKFDYFGNQEFDTKIYIKLIGPYGLKFNREVSPKGYTTDDTFHVAIGEHQERTVGWGNDDGGIYERGTWRAELWFEGKNVPEEIAYFKVI
jgi:hypothetical protein